MKFEYMDPYNWKKPVTVDLPEDTPQEIIKEAEEFLDEDYKRVCALEERERYHREFSLDALDYEDLSIAYHETPEDIVIRQEEIEEHRAELARVQAGKADLTETQLRRLEMVEDGKTLRQIAEADDADLSSVAESIKAARKKLEKHRRNTPTNRL